MNLLQRMCCTDEGVHMSQSPDFVLEGDQLNISCAVGYTGILAPRFTWHPTPDNILSPVDTDSSVKSTVQVTVPSFPRSVQTYTCYVTFSGSVFPSSANQTSTAVNTSGEWRAPVLALYSHIF